MKLPFFNKLKYRKERVGVVEKNGKTYVKYMKVRRFKISKTVKYSLLIVSLLAVLGVGIKLLMSDLASRPPVDEVADGIGG